MHRSVTVPATCANLGPGFDALAVAVDLHLTVASVGRTDRRVVAEGEGADELSAGEENLIWRGLVAYCERFGRKVPDVSLGARNDVPLERGLGSSAAAAVAGLTLGRALVGGDARDQELVDLATDLEGHPDNAAAALLGGLVVCAGGRSHRLEPTESLRPVLCVPDQRQSTEVARGVLPSDVPLAVAAASGGRAALVVAGLTGIAEWDPAAMTDDLHEPARLSVMTASGALIGALRAAGLGACLSGAGPAVLAVVPAADGAVVDRIRDLAGPGWCVEASRWDRAGARVIDVGPG